MSKNETALVPTSLGEAQQLAEVLSKSTLIPQDLRGKVADVFVTIMAGRELGLLPMAALRSIHVIKGKPVLSADGMVGVAQASGHCEYFRCVESTDKVAVYETKRRGAPEPQRLSFSIDEAKLAGLTGDNWKKYPAAMLRARAKAALCRDVYPDAMAGVYEEDEAREFAERLRPNVIRAMSSELHESAIDAEVVLETDQAADLIQRIQAASSLDDLGALVPEIKAQTDAVRKVVRPHFSDQRARILSAMSDGAEDVA